MKMALSIPDFGNIGAPPGVPTGGFGTLNNILGVAIQLALIGAIVFSVYNIIYAGIDMITSGGEKEKMASGRNRIRFAVIGLIFVFLSFLAINFLGSFLGIQFFGSGR